MNYLYRRLYATSVSIELSTVDIDSRVRCVESVRDVEVVNQGLDRYGLLHYERRKLK